jgi:DUF4097 and DUF4098 domain-containing protein YvlB
MSFPPPSTAPASITAPRFNIACRSAKVRVVATAGAQAHAEGATLRQQPDGSFSVVPSEFGSGDVVLVCPQNSDVTVGTSSGRIELTGDLGRVNVVTASGRIDVDHAASLDVRSSSAGIHVGRCDGDCRVATTSGGVHVQHAENVEISAVSGKVVIGDVNDAVVRTVNGSVSLGSPQGGRAHVRTVSGSVDITVPANSSPAGTLRSVSGKIRCEPVAGHDGELNVKTISGSIRVSIR